MSHYFISGASSGIGKALAIALASKGHIVSIVARRIEHLKELQKEQENIHIFPADVSNSSEIKRIVKACLKNVSV